jgi:CRISPR-associated protein Cst1
MKNHSVFYKSFKITEDDYIKVLDEVMDSIINLKKLDWLIEFVLKREQDEGISYYFLLKALIDVNSKIYKYVDGGEKMKREEIEKCARRIAAKIEENKLAAYRTKLTSSLVFKDYDRVCQILLQLSNYADVSLDCLLSTLENCEEYKNNVYLFIACLRKQGGEE